MGRVIVSAFAGLVALAAAVPVGAAVAPPLPDIFRGSEAHDGLVALHVDKAGGRILVTLPAPGADGVSMRMLYATALRTGLGAAPTFLDRGRVSEAQVLAFRPIGRKVALQFENPRFRAAGARIDRGDFGISTVAMADVVDRRPGGMLVIDLAPFLTQDTLGIATSLNQEGDAFGTGDARGGGKGFHLDDKRSAADPGSVKLFPDNLEIDAIQTFVPEKPGDEVENIVPDPHSVSFTVHHSFVRLPGPGFAPRVFDPRIGGFATQVVDFSAPLGTDVVRDLANRFRLEKTDPGAARSRVKKPIVFYLDRDTPEPIRTALLTGINWWGRAFDAAGYIDAFRAEPLPEGADPMDVRYNIVNWVDRATRGWSYGQEIVDPRTGEIVKGMVVLGSLRARQDIQIFEGLAGAAQMGSGGPNDPVRVALARLAQLGAHEVGHALGFAHNFAASTQDRASVMDYPGPRIGLVDGSPDLSDAYGTGVGRWDMATVGWLYGDDTKADAHAAQAVAAGLRYVPDDNARAPDTAQPWGALWDDGADPIAELTRLMQVRRVAIDRFGLGNLSAGEPVADLRRRFVPVWLLDRYQIVAAAKSVGGVDFSYAIAGEGHEAAPPVPGDRQRAALAALLATLAPDQLRVPAGLLPLLSAARNGSDNRQYDIEIFSTAGGPVFDPLVAGDVAAEITLGALLAPGRLERVAVQHAADPAALGLDELLDRLLAATLPERTDALQRRIAATLPERTDALQRRIAYRTIVTLAQVAGRPGTSPDVAATIAARLHAVAGTLAKRRGDEAPWAADLARRLDDPRELEKLAADRPRTSTIPPADPIGGEDDWMDAGVVD